MYDRIQKALDLLGELEGHFDPSSLYYGTTGPEKVLTEEDLAKLQEAIEELNHVQDTLDELKAVIDACDLGGLATLAESNKVSALAEFNFDATQQNHFEDTTTGDEEKLDEEQADSSGHAIDRLNELVEEAKPELEAINGKIKAAVEHLHGVS